MSDSDFFTEDGVGEIDQTHLAEIARAALPYLGPYSITAVKRASKGCNDLQVLCDMVASQITEPDKRQRFSEIASRLVHKLKDPQGYAAAVTAGRINPGEGGMTGDTAASSITPELRERGEKALAHIIGPLARVLVSRYAKTSENSRQFFDLLAGHIRNPEERQAFFDIVRSESL